MEKPDSTIFLKQTTHFSFVFIVSISVTFWYLLINGQTLDAIHCDQRLKSLSIITYLFKFRTTWIKNLYERSKYYTFLFAIHNKTTWKELETDSVIVANSHTLSLFASDDLINDGCDSIRIRRKRHIEGERDC